MTKGDREAMAFKLEIDPAELYRNAVYWQALYLSWLMEEQYPDDTSDWFDETFVFRELLNADGCLVFREQGRRFAGTLMENDLVIEFPRRFQKKTASAFAEAGEESVRRVLGPACLEQMQVDSYFFCLRDQGKEPLVTTALWSEPEGVFSADSPEDFHAQGGAFLMDVLASGKAAVRDFLAEEVGTYPPELLVRAELLYEAKLQGERFESFLASGKLETDLCGRRFIQKLKGFLG